MLSLRCFQGFVFLLCIFKSGKAVSVSIRSDPTWPIYQHCRNLSPGECCKALPVAFNNYMNPFAPATAEWSNLLPTDVAAVWGRRGQIRDCSGTPIDTRAGPGSWRYEGTGGRQPRGASFVRLPAGNPPVNDDNINWLTAEGMLGFVWGGGRWFSKAVAPESFIRGGEGAGPGRRMRTRLKRGIVSAQKGTAYVQAPRKSRWPDAVVVNGTEYRDAGGGDLRYESAEGGILPLDR